ncbi:MAG: DNA polymerase IV [Pseudolysinimonas sp.]|uniref:DNA polymerase IV n=1 Tax=Pseudolysinimonas sp. TaxID=2680009 RepID=UPI003C781BA7
MSKQDGSGRQVTASPVDDLTAHLLHVDMDAFFASVELLEHPELVGKPVIVGHPSARSVVTAATYEARKFGVNSAMPMAVALRRCPQAIVLEPHYDRYTKYSGIVMDIFRDVTPMVEVLGIDEAFLDVAGARRLMGAPWQIGTLIRERVFAETGLRCSVGAAATKYVAKLASSRAKPDGLLVVPEADTLAFLHPQPISALWGVGAKTAEKLERLGLRTVADVADVPLDALTRAVGPAMAAHFHALAWGRDPRQVVTEQFEKSIGHERTFETNIADVAELEKEMLRLANAVGARLRGAGVQARTVALKLRFADFSTISRSRTLPEPTDLGRRLYEEARTLYAESGRAGEPVRLLGVRGEQLVGRVVDAGLWDDDGDWREAEHAVDAITAKFGRSLVRPATLLGDDPDRRMPMRGEPA